MAFGFLLLTIIFILWQLLVEGWLWKLILGIFGWLGLHWALISYIPSSQNVCLTIFDSTFSWAVVLPSIVLFMSMLYTKE